MDQPKIERMLRMMLMMSGNINYSIDELAEHLDMSYRTIYRYIDTFKAAGLTVTKLYSNTYKIEKVPRNMPDFDRLLYFSEEEAALIHSVIEAIVPTNSLKKGIKKKLAVVYDSTSIEQFTDFRSNAAHVENLRNAAKEKKKVILKGYESGKVQEEGWTAEKQHKRQGMDVFRMAGPTIGHITWKMTVMAKNLLLEEYPLAMADIKRQGNYWILDTDLSSYVGACRFFLGLSHEIKINDSPEFLEYVKEYVKKNLEEL